MRPWCLGGFFRREVAEAEAWQRRQAMLRAVAQQTLAAIDFCHSADVIHGSLGPGSVFMNTSEDCDPDDLQVRRYREVWTDTGCMCSC